MKLLEIKNLHVNAGDEKILKGINLTFRSGEVVAIMGPNGNGKSTLLKAIMNHPSYEIVSGDILVDGESILELETDERSKLGLFLGMQSPVEIEGVHNTDFMRLAMESHGKNISSFGLFTQMKKIFKELNMNSSLKDRYLNHGFSGGEKKKNEVMQFKLLDSKFIMLDEIDSGLDVDALKVISDQINKEKNEHPEKAFIMISHYERLFHYVAPTRVVVILDGKVAIDGDSAMVRKIDQQGYGWING